MPDIFLSYSREDQPTARRFADGLQRAGFSVWWDQTLSAGEHYDKVTEQALREAKAVVVLWSKASVNSRWVRAEATIADRNGTLVPVMIEPCDRPVMFELTQTAELAHWQGVPQDPAWLAFVGAVRRIMGKSADNSLPPTPAFTPAITAATGGGAKPFSAGVRVVAVVALLLVFAAGFLLWSHSQAPARQVTLAVLPFRQLPANSDPDDIAGGLASDVNSQLSQIAALTVLEERSTARFKDSTLDPREIASELGVDYLVSATLQRAGEQLRVTVSLANGADGATVSSRAYETELGAVSRLEFQRDLAKEIAEQVGVVLEVGDLPPAQGGTKVIDAYLKYKRARKLYNDAEGYMEQVVPLLREALQLDDSFNVARMHLYFYLSPAIVQTPSDAAELRAEQEREAQRLEAMPRDWQLASGFLATRRRLQHRWEEGLAAAATSNSSENRVGEVLLLIETGQFENARLKLSRIVETDRLAAFPSFLLQQVLTTLGRPDEAREEADRFNGTQGIKQQTGAPAAEQEGRLNQLLATGSHEDPAAMQSLKMLSLQMQSSGLASGISWPSSAMSTAALGSAETMHKFLRRALADPANHVEGRLGEITSFAIFYGDQDLALEALRLDKLKLHNAWPFTLWSYPRLRGTPGFRNLLDELGLVDYWRESGKWSDFCRAKGAADFECFDKPVQREDGVAR